EGQQGRIVAAGGADDLIPVHEWRFAVTPGWYAPAKIARQAALPQDLAVSDLQARQVAGQAQDIEPFPIDRRGAARTFFSLRHELWVACSEARGPQFLA